MILPGGMTICIHLEQTHTSRRTCSNLSQMLYANEKGKKEEIQYYHPIMKRSFGSVIGSWCQWFHLRIITCDVDGWPFVE